MSKPNREIQIHHHDEGVQVHCRTRFNGEVRTYKNISYWSGRRLERLANGRNVIWPFRKPEIQNVRSRFYCGGFFTGIFIEKLAD